ncbi:hypothetical protein N9971_00660 [bacterium]|nr:hypothetical protein [bacterium]
MLSVGAILSLALAVGAVAFVAAPLFRPDAAEAERVARHASEEVDLQQRREMVMATLRDLEDDRATEKITDEDYQQIHATLTARAVEIMKRRDELEAEDLEKQRSKTIRHPSAQADDPEGSRSA